MWNEIIIEDWQDFNEIVIKLNPKDWVFRGQSNVEWKLKTSFHRSIISIRAIKATAGHKSYNRDGYEKEIIELFKSQYHLYQSKTPDENADFFIELTKTGDTSNVDRTLEWLSVMQHYGVPTRLLDWTFSPYIALFFALENADKDCCVYALNQKELQEIDKEVLKSNYKNDVFKNRKGAKSFVRPYEPRFKNERLVRQQGLFLVPSTNFETFDSILGQYELDDDEAKKIIIPEKLRYRFLLMLKRINITNETLFPGIEGFCKSLKFSLLETASNIKRLK